MKTAVEELLRYDSPVQMFRRILKEDVNYNGHQMHKSDIVVLIIASGNRDPQQFQNPDELCLERADNKHLAFGGGPHYCLGASLARLEAEIAFRELFSRFATLRLATTDLQYMQSAGLRGLESLMLSQ